MTSQPTCSATRQTLDRTAPVPLWAQLADELTRRIANRDFVTCLPTEAQLMSTYGVSRHTVRAAVAVLEQRGVAKRERGHGTLICGAPMDQPIDTRYRLAPLGGQATLADRSNVHRQEVVTDPVAAGALGRAGDTELVHVERLRFAGDEPVALYRSWVPLPEGAGLLDADLTSGSLYDLLAIYCSVRVSAGWERIEVAVPTPREQSLLEVADGVAVLVVYRQVRAAGVPIEWRTGIARADRYAFYGQWPGPSSAPPRSPEHRALA